ncbi:MAG: hypothetical protein Q8K26_05140, partial [Candidatus Gracilibacteria bacterium]|nr:hypothetical protein [Candidatus Gracilibacteria bacterium]
MPSLPLITLPDLPPPPTIPKLLGSIAAVLDIFKLVAKVKCIMNINPFVPEWRAGDQIAQITERQGKSAIDFINLEYPNFPMSFTDGIKVKTYVNLEFEVEFILEMARATLGPLNTVTNNVSNLTGSQPTIPNVDLRNTVPDNINVNTEIQGYIPKENPLNALVRHLSFNLLSNFITLNTYMHRHVGEEASVAVFKDILQGNIATIRSEHDPRTLAITDTLQKAIDYRGDKEDVFIKDLSAQNTEKFRVLKEYVRGEKTETTRLKTEINAMLRSGKMSESIPALRTPWSPNIKIAALNTSLSSNTEDIQKQIRANNEKIIPSMKAIASGGGDSEGKDIAETGKKLLTGVQTGLESFGKDMQWNAGLHSDEYQQSSQKLLALETATNSPSSTTTPSQTQSMYSYEYNGIYILDKNGRQTRLFDYTDGVDGT